MFLFVGIQLSLSVIVGVAVNVPTYYVNKVAKLTYSTLQ